MPWSASKPCPLCGVSAGLDADLASGVFHSVIAERYGVTINLVRHHSRSCLGLPQRDRKGNVAGGCSVCLHPNRTEIDHGLQSDSGVVALADRWKIDRHTLRRHAARCMGLVPDRPGEGRPSRCMVCLSDDVDDIEAELRIPSARGEGPVAQRVAKARGFDRWEMEKHRQRHMDNPDHALRMALRATRRLAALQHVAPQAPDVG